MEKEVIPPLDSMSDGWYKEIREPWVKGCFFFFFVGGEKKKVEWWWSFS